MTDNRTTELLPCPFCGGEADVMLSQSRWGQSYTIHHAEKGRCPAGFVASMQFATEAEAIAAWNTRAERTVYIVETTDDLLDSPCVETTCYAKKEDAIKRAESQTYTDEDGVRYWAHWTELKVVGE